MQISKNFWQHEFSCPCCSVVLIDAMLISMMQAACDHFAKKYSIHRVIAVVTSGNRCRQYNFKVQQSLGLPQNNSQHQFNCAADWYIKGVTPMELYNYLDREYGDYIGLGLYGNRVHLDTRGTKARW